MLQRTLMLLSSAYLALSASSALPAELFSPLVAQKVLATAQTAQSPAQYPQYTDRIQGVWQYFSPDTWTSGFFPSTLYALNTRASICPTGDLTSTDWVSLARSWSAAEVPLETKTSVGHDVGFLSFPFAEELKMCVFASICLLSIHTERGPLPYMQTSGERDCRCGRQQLRAGARGAVQPHSRMHAQLGYLGSYGLPSDNRQHDESRGTRPYRRLT